MKECEHVPLEEATIYRWLRPSRNHELVRLQDELYCKQCGEAFASGAAHPTPGAALAALAAGRAARQRPARRRRPPTPRPGGYGGTRSPALDAPMARERGRNQGVTAEPIKRKRGRPKGSKNKPKTVTGGTA